MSLPCMLRRIGSQRCQAWPYLRVGTHPLSRSFSIGSTALSKKSIAEELGLPKPPAKPLLPFAKYLSVRLKDYPHISWTDRMKLLSENWNKQNPEERARRLGDYYEEKKEFQLKYKAYISQLTPEQVKSLEEAVDRRKKAKESAKTKREKKKEMENLGRPKHPNNCFVLFLTSLRSSDPCATQGHNKEFLANASAKWKALPENERKRYKEEGARLMQQYEEAIFQWEQRMVSIGRPELVRKCSSLHTHSSADSTFPSQAQEVNTASDTHSASLQFLTESPYLEGHDASLESKRETIFKVYPDEAESQKSVQRVPPPDTNKALGISSTTSLHDDEIFAEWSGRYSGSCSGDDLYSENSESENFPHVEDEILDKIESLHLDTQQPSKGYGQSYSSLPSMHIHTAFFSSDNKRNTDQLDGP